MILVALIAFSHNATALTLVESIFDYECKQANAAGLAFKCARESNDGVLFPIFTVHSKMEAKDNYRLNLLAFRFFQIGGRHFNVIFEKEGTTKSCGNLTGRKYWLSCSIVEKAK